MATIETLKSKRRWYTRQADKPWETGSAVYIIVRGDTTERDKPQAEYFTEDIMLQLEVAAEKEFKYGNAGIQENEISS